ncbi:alpha-L-fucosidase [Dermatophagoides farinae]|uniref:alpha-L-fucosidase n=1 Tax=Dermatophagoides farinae TaxID=6954 RepID=UPI003F5EF864
MFGKISLTILLIYYCLSIVSANHYKADWTSIDKRPLPEWFDEAKIGIFIHWGVFSVPSFGTEWFWHSWSSHYKSYDEFMKKNYRPDFTYADFAKDFTTELFDPIEWASIFNKSGARYVVLTSKHHEGYTLWPSNYSFNWNAKDVGPNKDLVGELATAIRNVSLRFGLYHSLFEWYNPLYLRDKKNNFRTDDFVKSKIRPEMEELVNAYHPDVLWSDGEWEAPDTYWKSTDFLAWLYNESPVKDRVVVNDRWGKGTLCKHGGYFTCQDRYNPGVLQTRKWENAMTLDKQSWGFRREAILEDYLTIEELIYTLVKTISCGGNILINVGPTKYGKLVPIFEERLEQLGSWLQINGEAIYETKPWHRQNDSIASNVWYTQRGGDTVYAITLGYPKNGTIILGDVHYDQIESIQLLGTDKRVRISPIKATHNETVIEFPDLNPNDKPRYAFTFKIHYKQ